MHAASPATSRWVCGVLVIPRGFAADDASLFVNETSKLKEEVRMFLLIQLWPRKSDNHALHR